MNLRLGSWRWKMAIGVVIIACVGVLLLRGRGNSAQRAVEETRQALRKQGFKTDLADFDFSTPATEHGFQTTLADFSRDLFTLHRFEPPDLLKPVGSNAAIVAWRERGLTTSSGEVDWLLVNEALDAEREELDALCEKALSGRIRFNLEARRGSTMLLPHLAGLKNFAQALGSRMLLDLHEDRKDAAWTNLLAVTRLVTAWDTEPIEVSELVRFSTAETAFDTAWQALQAEGWSDERLARLQQEWEGVDFLQNLSQTAAFARASSFAMYEWERQQPVASGFPLTKLLQDARRSPQFAWSELLDGWRQARLRNRGIFENERSLLLFYRDREIELRRAVQASTWAQMRELPGATNSVPFLPTNRSGAQSIMNARALSLRMQNAGRTLLGRAAEAEARRRVLVAAVALERFRGRHGAYPKSLSELAPELLKNPPTDFMDGRPLHYQLTDDGHFVLYSLGLDGIDHGGLLPAQRQRDFSVNPYGYFPGRPGSAQSADLVWPRPASAAVASLVAQAEKKVREDQIEWAQEQQSAFWWDRTAARQSMVEKILAAKPDPMTNEPSYQGRPLSEVLSDPSGAAKFTLTDLLTLKQVLTGAEPDTATFELPIRYDALTNLGNLRLYIDPSTNEDFDEGCNAAQMDCVRATNGDCLLVWRTIYEVPGKHALQAGLELKNPSPSDDDLCGPIIPFVVSNLCQFSVISANFDPQRGATLHARLADQHASYIIELNSPAGQRLKTITGATTNGIIKVRWDLIDDHGQLYRNESFDTVFHLTLPDSGLSQTLKGP